MCVCCNDRLVFPGRKYNTPILMWLLESFPFTPPVCMLRPTANMVIREGRHVDPRGRIHLPSLHNWDHVRRPRQSWQLMFFFFCCTIRKNKCLQIVIRKVFVFMYVCELQIMHITWSAIIQWCCVNDRVHCTALQKLPTALVANLVWLLITFALSPSHLWMHYW